MGQDAQVSGSEVNAKMSYMKSGVRSRKDINSVGRNLNLFSGREGVNISRGAGGGIEVSGELFPWYYSAFGYKIGLVEGTPAENNRQKVRIYPGDLYIGEGASATKYSVENPTDLTLASNDLSETEPYDYIWLKHLTSVEDEDQDTIVVSTGTLETGWEASTNSEIYVLLYIFENTGAASSTDLTGAYGKLVKIANYGDVRIGDSASKISFGYSIGVTSGDTTDLTKVHITEGSVLWGQKNNVTEIKVDGKDITIIAGTNYIFLKFIYDSEIATIELSSTILVSDDDTYYRLFHEFELVNETVSLIHTYSMFDVEIPRLEEEKVYTGITWDTTNHQIKADVKQYYLMPVNDDEASEEVILTAELCP